MKITNDSSILILSHYYKRTLEGGGPPQEIRDYFRKIGCFIAYIEHPFPYADDNRSSLTIYENGKLRKQYFTFPVFGPEPLFYIIDILFTWYFIAIAKKKYDLCVALDNLNTISVFPYRKLKIIHTLVFYTIDYTPVRFKNTVLNTIYQHTDKLACYTADAIWVLSKRMTEMRKKMGVQQTITAPSILLPMGANLKRIKIQPIEKINKFHLVFVGHLLEKQGLQRVFEALTGVIKHIPQIKLLIVGKGSYEKELKALVKKLKISKNVVFKGFIETHEKVEQILCKSAVGLAPYVPDADNYTYYTDPGKPKLYLACGLPVIITDVPESANVIQRFGAGLCIPYKKEAFEKAIITLLKNNQLYKKYRKNAIKLSKQFDTEILISNAVKKT